MEIPFLQNVDGISPMDLCLKHGQFTTADLMLKYLKHYPFDHHSRALESALPHLVEKEVPAFLPYLESRVMDTALTKKLNRGLINEDTQGLAVSCFRLDVEEVKEQLFQKGKNESEVETKILDLPKIHDYLEPLSAKFFEALADTEDFDLFTSQAIKKVIDFKYPTVREYTVKKLFIPYIFFLIVFMAYVNVIYEFSSMQSNLSDPTWFWVDASFQLVLAIFSCYFLNNEVSQLLEEGITYFASVWNYIDIIPPVINFVIIASNIMDGIYTLPTNVIRVIMAVAVFFMWFKLLYFLRIFKDTGYLIRMIIEVVADMRFFLLILFVSQIAFGNAIYMIALANSGK